MNDELLQPSRPVAESPPGLVAPANIRGKMHNDWRTIDHLVRKARHQIAATDGVYNKLREIRRLLRKAQSLLATRMQRPHPQTRHSIEDTQAAQSRMLADLFPDAPSGPACKSLGGGTIALSFEPPLEEVPLVTLRDGFGNLHAAQVINVGYAKSRQTSSHASDAPSPVHGTSAVSNGIHSDTDRFVETSLSQTIDRLLVQAPSELFENQPGHVDVLVHSGSRQLAFSKISVENAPTIQVTTFSFEGSKVSISGRTAAGGYNDIKLALFVDNELSASCTLAPTSRTFSGSIIVDRGHLDGRPHLVELRELPRMAILASRYEILPLYITPWNALQIHARPPLDGTLAPQARHHFRSYQLWFEKRGSEDARPIPPLGEIFTELSQGFRKRHIYPKIQFEIFERPIVSIVIPVHNKFEVTYYCLCSLLFAFNDSPFEVIVVDDGSSDETRDISEFVAGINVIRREKSVGFVQACNEGAAHARGDFIALLNNDTQVTARWLDELVSVYRDFDNVGLVGSKLVYPDGRLQEAGGVIWGSGNPWNVGRGGNPEDPRYNYLRRTDYVSGAAIMIRRKLWIEVGGFSAEFAPAYFEDTDLAMKVRESGCFVVYVPASTVYHFEGQSAGRSVASGQKYYQEVNRPKFKKKWSHAFEDHGEEGKALDREKDRDVAFRVLFIDHQFPHVDIDAGSHAAFQEARLFQSLGAKVTFLPRNLAWMDRHTMALQRMGVECLYAPYVTNFAEYIRSHAAEYDVVYVCRYKIAEQVIPLVRSASRETKVIFNLADLHFLRELREAAAKSPGYSRARAEETRRAELAMVTSSDLTFSYSEVELAVLESQVSSGTCLAKMPWIVDSKKLKRRFSDTQNILFLGGFGHHPNGLAARFFATEVMPVVRQHLPEVVFTVIGSGGRATLSDLASESVKIIGYVPDLDKPLAQTRIFVAPLFAGAGLKGKVLEAISRGIPCVLSSVAAESTGLVDGINCLIADSRDAWIENVIRLYTDEELWNQIGASAHRLAETRYSFAKGALAFGDALAKIGIAGRKEWGMVYKHARPQRYGY